MELREQEWESFEQFLGVFSPLVGDRRTWRTFEGTVKGILAAESLVCARIARFSP